MKIILLSIYLVGILFGGWFGLWKFDKWLRPLETGELDPKTKKTENPVYVIRNRLMILRLGDIWIYTLVVGILGTWKKITAPLLISITLIFSFLCIINITKKRYCNICVGSCYIYGGLLYLFAIYKLGHWHFSISFWWLVLRILLYVIFLLLSLWLFARGGYKVHTKGENKHQFPASAIGIALFAYPITRGVVRVLKQNNVGNDFFVPMVMTCLLLLLLLNLSGVRYILLDDSKMLRNNDPEIYKKTE